MRRALLLCISLLVLTGLPAVAQDQKSSVRRVYFLPMGNGLDQFLANQVSMQGVYEVVTDPELADALFTDQIGLKFERQLEELYPPEPEPESEPEAEEGAEDGDEDTENGGVSDEDEGEPEVQQVPLSSFGRGKGNIFLVGRESKKILWSIYHRPKNTSSKELNKAAELIVTSLREGTF